MRQLRVYIGHTHSELVAYAVACFTLRATARLRPDEQLWTAPISRHTLYQAYSRPTKQHANSLYDVVSQAPMSTEHAIARFFVPYLQDYRGWALFTDGDVLWRRSVTDLFDQADDRYAVMCVQHPPQPIGDGLKKDHQIQQAYPRKNWSSVMLFNCGHPANRSLDLATLNSWPGRDLHAFKWLSDDLIGPLHPTWNYLVNVSAPLVDPCLVHFTEGVPSLQDHWDDPYGEEWRSVAHGLSASHAMHREEGVSSGTATNS